MGLHHCVSPVAFVWVVFRHHTQTPSLLFCSVLRAQTTIITAWSPEKITICHVRLSCSGKCVIMRETHLYSKATTDTSRNPNRTYFVTNDSLNFEKKKKKDSKCNISKLTKWKKFYFPLSAFCYTVCAIIVTLRYLW